MWQPSHRPSSQPAAGALHIWRIDVSGAAARRAAGFLAAEETARADRMVSAGDRLSWITSRGCLRWLVGSYCGVDPLSVSFVLGPHGKPALSRSGGTTASLAFSVSHTEHHVLLAFTHGVAVGIDIEEVRALPELDALIATQCTSEEALVLRMVADRQERTREFLARWTEKEAIAKAVGLGIHLDFASVSLDAGTGCARLPSAIRMQVHGKQFECGAAASGAYAAVGTPLQPSFLHFEPAADLETE